MAALTTVQEREVAAYWADSFFGQKNAVANMNLDHIQAAVHAIDAVLDTVLNTLTPTDTVLQAINKSIPAPFSGRTVQERTLLVSHTILKRSGLI